MSDVVYRSEIKLTRRHGPLRTAKLPAGESVEFGVHGGIATHYGVSLDEHPPISATIDYIVAAAAG